MLISFVSFNFATKSWEVTMSHYPKNRYITNNCQNMTPKRATNLYKWNCQINPRYLDNVTNNANNAIITNTQFQLVTSSSKHKSESPFQLTDITKYIVRANTEYHSDNHNSQTIQTIPILKPFNTKSEVCLNRVWCILSSCWEESLTSF